MIEWQRPQPRRPTRRKPSRFDRLAKLFSVTVWIGRRVWRYAPQRLPYAMVTVILVFVLTHVVLGGKLLVEHVVVTGTHLTDPAAVTQIADLEGHNLFTINTTSLQERIMSLGVFDNVQVSVRLPGTVSIQVNEQSPAYIWKVDPTLYLVAHDGTIIGPTPNESERVIVVDADHQPVQIGQKLDPRILEEAAYLLAVLPSTTSLAPHYLLYSHGQGLMVPTNDGFTVVIGDDSNLQEKLQMLGPTLHAAEAATPHPAVVDVRFLRRPFFH